MQSGPDVEVAALDDVAKGVEDVELVDAADVELDVELDEGADRELVGYFELDDIVEEDAEIV